MRRLCLALVVFVVASLPAAAQTSLLPTLQRIRPEYPTPMSPGQLAELLNRVAWEHRAEGWGLLRKPSGNRCPAPQGVDVACDILVHAPSVRHFDVLIDTAGAAAPAWQDKGPCVLSPTSGCEMSNFLAPIGSSSSPPPSTAPLTGANYRLFWQHQTLGYLAAWNMNGSGMVSGTALSPSQVSDNDWKIVGTSDFNGDGQADLFWQHQQTRLMAVWLMNGNTFLAPGVLSNNSVSDRNWVVRAIADMNGDGQSDLVWQHETEGWLAVWFMNGLTFIEGRLLSPNRVTDLDWRIAGAGDFNGDGQNDLLWQNNRTGVITIWFMNGTNFAGPGAITPNTVADTNWKIKTVVDIDGDGKPDFVWHEQTSAGWLVFWIMDGTNLRLSRLMTPERVPDTGWRIVGSK
jgi:hypothetical protein